MMKQTAPRKLFRLIVLMLVAVVAAYIWWEQSGKIKDYDLLAASASGDMQAVETLLRDGAEVNRRFGGDGETPLHRAATAGRTELVELLLMRHADPNICDSDGATPLLAASYKGNTEIVKLLLKAGADPNQAENRYGTTPLIVAAWKGQAATVRVLLEGGADPSRASKDGNTARSRARAEGHPEILRLLDGNKEHSQNRVKQGRTTIDRQPPSHQPFQPPADPSHHG